MAKDPMSRLRSSVAATIKELTEDAERIPAGTPLGDQIRRHLVSLREMKSTLDRKAYFEEGKVLGMLEADFDIDQLREEMERCETCRADPNLRALDHFGHRDRQPPAQ